MDHSCSAVISDFMPYGILGTKSRYTTGDPRAMGGAGFSFHGSLPSRPQMTVPWMSTQDLNVAKSRLRYRPIRDSGWIEL